MPDTAQQNTASTPRLLSKMRGAFTQSVPPTPQPAPQPTVKQQAVLPSTDQKLDVLDTVLAEVEQSTAQSPQPVQQQNPPQLNPQQPIQARQQNMGMVAQATPTAIDQAVYQQQEMQAAQMGGASNKEAVVAGGGPAPVEAGASIQYVEHEQTPELSPEVSEYLQHVEDHANQAPQELVVGEAQQQQPLPTNYQKQAVVILPITPETEKEGEKKGPLESIKWLVEWSRKLMKMFNGQIIYREVEK